MDRAHDAPAKMERMSVAIFAAATLMFVLLGGSVLSDSVRTLLGNAPTLSPALTSAFILNIALVLFTWQRCNQLRLVREAQAAAEHKAEISATRDFTTGLLNRGGFTQAAERQFDSARVALTLVVIDLDHFKKVNDLYGHSAGDLLLKTIGQRLNDLVPSDALCGRLGGDEFAILLVGDAASVDRADALASKLTEVLRLPVQTEGGLAQVGASVGLARGRSGETSFGTLLRRSDIAMYQAKKQGRNCAAWFDLTMEAEVLRQNQLETDMRAGIPDGQFVPFFQPQFSLETGDLHGFEVLARWNHPTQGLIEPDVFIPLAEATGQISLLSMTVMRAALVAADQWDPNLKIAVNVSPVQLKDPLFDQRVMKLLVETGFAAGRLELEITETALFDDLEGVLKTMNSLKAIGVSISLDDFGTGYASIAQLKSLPFDRIKIDRGFTMSVVDNAESAAIVGAIAMLGRSLRVPVTAEGVETQAILQRLAAIGCSEGQGWHYGRALGADEIGQRFPTETRTRPEDGRRQRVA